MNEHLMTTYGHSYEQLRQQEKGTTKMEVDTIH